METFLGLFIVSVLSRILPHAANFTAVGATSLFAGSRLGFVRGTILMVMIMFITDAILGFHGVMWATYGSIILSVAISVVDASVKRRWEDYRDGDRFFVVVFSHYKLCRVDRRQIICSDARGPY